MGESTNSRAKLRFDRRIRLEFARRHHHLGRWAADPAASIDDALGLTETANRVSARRARGGRNVQHRLVGPSQAVGVQSSGRLRGYQRR